MGISLVGHMCTVENDRTHRKSLVCDNKPGWPLRWHGPQGVGRLSESMKYISLPEYCRGSPVSNTPPSPTTPSTSSVQDCLDSTHACNSQRPMSDGKQLNCQYNTLQSVRVTVRLQKATFFNLVYLMQFCTHFNMVIMESHETDYIFSFM